MQTVTTVVKTEAKTTESNQTQERRAESAPRWTAVQRVRLPHRVGLPLSCGGGGDASN